MVALGLCSLVEVRAGSRNWSDMALFGFGSAVGSGSIYTVGSMIGWVGGTAGG